MGHEQQFRMPDVGEGLTEAEIIRWLVEPGQDVGINDMIVEIETAKSLVELPSPFAGTVIALHHPVGAIVAVGEPIITVGTPSDEAEPERQEVLVGYGPSGSSRRRRARRTVAAAPVEAGASVRAKPPVRKLAKDLGIPLATIVPTGANGDITRADVLAAAAGAGATPRAVRSPISMVRRATADAMVASAFTAPHASVWMSVDITRTMKLAKRLGGDPEYRDIRVSPLTLIMRAAIHALVRYPEVNSRWDASASEIVQFLDVNLGVAVATDRGLLVPNIRGAQDLSTRELATAFTSMVAVAREGRLQPEQMRAGTFTITNVGVFGVDGGIPILNPGEAAILCVGQISDQPWNHKGKVRLRKVTTLSLSFDHRLVDGELGSRFLADIARQLTDGGPDLA